VSALDGKVGTGDARLSDQRAPLDLSVSTAKLVDAAVTSAKLFDAAVTTAKIADAAVTSAKILDGNVTTAKIVDAAVTSAKISEGNVMDAKLADAKLSLANGGTVAGNVTFTGQTGIRGTFPSTIMTGLLWAGVGNDCAVRVVCTLNRFNLTNGVAVVWVP
jgi:hypothetical protein